MTSCLTPENKRWTTEEKAILKEVYPVGGREAVRAILPNRSSKSIQEMALMMHVQVLPDVAKANRRHGRNVARAANLAKTDDPGQPAHRKPGNRHAAFVAARVKSSSEPRPRYASVWAMAQGVEA